MKEQILLLVELQNVDNEMEELLLKKVDLPAGIASLDEELEAIAEKLREGEQRLDNLKADHKAKETILRNGIENTKKAKSRLLEVKTNKEYEATLKEIDVISEKSSEIEDAILHLLVEIDNVSEELKANEAQGKTRRAGCETGKKKLKKELDSIGAALDGVLKKREAIRSEIKAKFLKKFDALKNLKNGRAVVPVWKEVCYGCHMNIPPQMYNELQRNESLMSCPHCERMIYWESRDDDV